MTRIPNTLVCVAMLLCVAVSSATAELALTQNGGSAMPIVIAADAPQETVHAAETLAQYIGKIAAARPAILTGDAAPAEGGAIWVGPHPRLESRFPGLSLVMDKPEAILLHANQRDVLILGRDRFIGDTQVEYGTANAVYTFIQDQLGVRWFWPGALGEDIQPTATIRIAPFTYRHAPVFQLRAMNKYRIQYGPHEDEFLTWHRQQRNELHSLHFSAGHHFSNWGGRYFEQHPEYFAQAPDGTRGWTYKEGRLQICVSSAALRQQWLDNVQDYVRQRPGHVLGASPVDGTRTGQCMCENCKAWDHPKGETVELVWGSDSGNWTRLDYVSLTERYVKFWNELGRGLKKQYPDQPDLMVGGMAYGVYSAPPVETRVEDNVVISHVGRLIIASEADRKASREAWLQWSEKAPHMTFRPNLFWYTGGMIGMPTVSTRKTIEDYRFLAEHSGKGINFDSWPGFFATQAPQLYLMMQLAWDPLQDGQALLDDFYTRAFGPAAGPVRRYFELMEEIHDEVSERVTFGSGFAARQAPAIYAELYTSERMARAATLLEEAAAATSGGGFERYAQRVAFIRSGLEFVNINLASIRVMAEVRASNGSSQQAVQEAIRLHALREDMLKADVSGFALGGRRFNQTRTSRGMVDFLGPPAAKFLKAGGMDDE